MHESNSPSTRGGRPAGAADWDRSGGIFGAQGVRRVAGAEQQTFVGGPLQDALHSGVEARLAEEVRRLVLTLSEFGSRAKAIGESAPPGSDLGKFVAVMLSLAGFQLAKSFSDDARLLDVCCERADYLEKLQLSLSDLFREIDLDGRRFLAVAFTEQRVNELLGTRER